MIRRITPQQQAIMDAITNTITLLNEAPLSAVGDRASDHV